MTENGSPKAIHLCRAAFACPPAEEKLAQTTWHAEFWLNCIASRAFYSVHVNGNGRFRAVRHTQYVGAENALFKTQDAAGGGHSFWG